MVEFVKSILAIWNSEKNQRLKLQYAYIILAILGLAAAGLLTLFNISSAHLAASISGILFITFLVNGVTWGIIEAFITPKLPKEPSAPAKKSARKWFTQLTRKAIVNRRNAIGLANSSGWLALAIHSWQRESSCLVRILPPNSFRACRFVTLQIFSPWLVPAKRPLL